VPAAEAVAGKELAPAWARQSDHVLHVRNGGGHGAQNGGVQRPAGGSEYEERRDAAGNLEASRGDVPMGEKVAGGVRDRPERQRARARSGDGADEASCRDVKGDDHECLRGGAGRRANEAFKIPRRIVAASPSKMLMTMRRAFVLLALVALGAAAPAYAQKPEPVVPAGVTIAGLDVGGLTESKATAAVQARFDVPLAIRIRRASVNVLPATLGARARVYIAVQAALEAAEGAAVPLEVVLNERKLRGWIAGRERRFYRAPRSSAVVLRDLIPWVTESKPGRRLLPYYSRLTIKHALRHHLRGPVRLATRDLAAARTRSSFGPVVVIRRGSKRLIYYSGSTASGMREVARFGVATGMAAYPTPLGRFTIVTKQRHPWWYPPSAGWAAGAKPIPPGPGNPLGTRWMGLSVGAVGIHGTPDAASIGYSASHGCIRMRIPNAEWLFDRVRFGTTVFIVGA
jgi:hypothetical protein